MRKELKVLIIDDHPLIISSFQDALQYVSENYYNPVDFNISSANDCGTAFSKIEKSVNEQTLYDLVFLDIKLPPALDKKILSGEDLGIKIRELSPETKIVVSTTYEDNYRIINIFKTINPDGFLIKSDLGPNELIKAIEFYSDDVPYYSKRILHLLKKVTTTDFSLDDIDRRILHELSKGAKMKELPDILYISLAAIEKRKRRLKELFDVLEGNDRDLFKTAEDKGFI